MLQMKDRTDQWEQRWNSQTREVALEIITPRKKRIGSEGKRRREVKQTSNARGLVNLSNIVTGTRMNSDWVRQYHLLPRFKMSILGASKASLTKAITNWETVKGKIPASVFQSVDFQSSGSLQALELRRATIQSYLRKFAQLSSNAHGETPSSNEGENSDAQEISAQESRVDGAIATAESIISSLSFNTLIDTNQLKSLSDTTQPPPVRNQEDQREHTPTPSSASDTTRSYVLPQRTADAPSEAQVVLQDLDPNECNYLELVRALKRRYDRPYKTRATLHKQLQQLPTARNNGQDLRSTWFRISGILHDGAVATAESIISSLSVRLNEVNTLIDTNQLKSLSDTTQPPPVRNQEDQREHTPTPSSASDTTRSYVLPQRTVDAPSLSPYYTQYNPVVQPQPLQPTSSAAACIQLGKLTLEPFTGDITSFIGEAQVVLQDLDPDECNYLELVRALKRRYDRPIRLVRLFISNFSNCPQLVTTVKTCVIPGFRISGILHGLRRYEDFRTRANTSAQAATSHLAAQPAANTRTALMQILDQMCSALELEQQDQRRSAPVAATSTQTADFRPGSRHRSSSLTRTLPPQIPQQRSYRVASEEEDDEPAAQRSYYRRRDNPFRRARAQQRQDHPPRRQRSPEQRHEQHQSYMERRSSRSASPQSQRHREHSRGEGTMDVAPIVSLSFAPYEFPLGFPPQAGSLRRPVRSEADDSLGELRDEFRTRPSDPAVSIPLPPLVGSAVPNMDT
ncbi:hypothetical protein OSTOST_06783 [Ostertagia ostertagi]